jgi:hypothetical protein
MEVKPGKTVRRHFKTINGNIFLGSFSLVTPEHKMEVAHGILQFRTGKQSYNNFLQAKNKRERKKKLLAENCCCFALPVGRHSVLLLLGLSSSWQMFKN